MKKLNLNEKTKRRLITIGSAMIGVGVLALVFTFTLGAKSDSISQAEPSSETSASAPAVSVGEIKVESGTEGGTTSAFVPESGASKSSSLTTISKPTSKPPKPVIEGDASVASDGKATPPTNPALTNKNVKPSYTSTPTVTKSTSSASGKSSTSSKSSTGSKPSGTTTSTVPSGGKPGQVYVPGFGWIYADKTPGETKTVSDAGGDINKQVGIMD